MVYDPITKDWVPRHGAGSVKKIADKHNWVMEEKPVHREAGMNPYEYAAEEKRKKKQK